MAIVAGLVRECRVARRLQTGVAGPVTCRPGFLICRPGNELRMGCNAGDLTLDLLASILGPVEVIATGPVRSPLPVTGPCSRCGSSTTVYGPAGSPLCDQCRDGGAPGRAK